MKLNSLYQFKFVRFNSSQQGFTLVELLVSTVVAGAIISASLGLINEQRRNFLGDRDRGNINDNVRNALNLIGADIRQGGELLEKQFELPVITVRDGNPTNQADSIVIQRRAIPETLTLCEPISGGETEIDITAFGSDCGTTTSQPINDLDETKNVANIPSWRKERCSQDGNSKAGVNSQDSQGCIPESTRGANDAVECTQIGGTDEECLWAFIVDKSNPAQNDFFLISGESEGTCTSGSDYCWKIHRAKNSRDFTYDYAAGSDNTLIYVLDEREYRLVNDVNTSRTDDKVLELIVNRQTPQRLTNLLDKMEISIPKYKDPNSSTSAAETGLTQFNENGTYVKDWQGISGIEVSIKGLNQNEANKLPDAKLTLKSQFFPRNINSADPPDPPAN
jgi:prepilin-type N-terminal cleavage/methylation domain-containing protein